MQTKLKQKTAIGHTDDYELLLFMSWKEEDEAEARAAFGLFVKNNKNTFIRTCQVVCRKNLPTYARELALDVYTDTLLKVYQNAGLIAEKLYQYKEKGGKHFKAKLHAYMNKMAQNTLQDIMIKLKPHYKMTDYKDDEGMIDYLDISDKMDSEEENVTQISEKAALIEKALGMLSPREQDVLLTYMRYHEGKKQLPKDEITALCQRWDVLPDYLRLIKKRAFEKLKKAINEIECIK